MLRDFIDWITSISPDLWKGAILGVILSAIFSLLVTILVRMHNKARRLTSIRQLLGVFAENNEECAIFTNEMFTKDRKYLSEIPDYFPPRHQKQYKEWINIPFVVGTANMRAAADILNLFGQAGKRENIEFHTISKDWNLWSKNIICIGGSCKTDKIFESCKPIFASLVPHDSTVVFKFNNSEKLFHAINNNDYGLVWKTNYPGTEKKCLVIIGLGSLGTESAAYYLRNNATILGKIYGSKDFACLIHVRLDHGKESAQICYLAPEPILWRKICHPIIWFKYFRNLFEKQ